MKIHEIMTRSPLTATASTPLKAAATTMVDARISGLPVTDEEGSLVGIITETDFLHHVPGKPRKPRAGLLRAIFSSGKGVASNATTVGDVMTRDVVVIGPGDDHSIAARLMERHRVKRLPVVEDGRLVGIVSRADLLGVLTRPDEAVAAEIREHVVHDLLMLDPDTVAIEIADGVVRLGGKVPTRTDARILEAVTRHVDGVVSVECSVQYEVDDYTPDSEPRPTGVPRPNW
jgi:CBS domain-containing protein